MFAGGRAGQGRAGGLSHHDEIDRRFVQERVVA